MFIHCHKRKLTSKQYIVLNMLKFNIASLVLVFLVHLISNVTGLVELSKRLQDSYTITTVQGVSIATCRLECESRQRCKSAIYHRDAHHCILTSNDTNSNVVRKGAVLLSGFHSSLDQNGSYSNCGGVTCLPQETCTTQGNGSNQVCKITECLNPRGLLPNGTTVKGNIYTVGSKIMVGCDQYMKTIHCGSNGNWTNVGSSVVLDFTDLCGTSGVYTTYKTRHVYRDMDTDQGNWLVFQRRFDGSEQFYRNWADYRNGFGDIQGECWLGLEIVYEIIQNGDYELRIDMENFNGEKRFAKYSTFRIGDEASYYTLNVPGYTGDAGDSLSSERGNRFSTLDKDNDDSPFQCAVKNKGAWWYHWCYAVLVANPNGVYEDGGALDENITHMHWPSWTWVSYTLRKTEMKIRRK